MRQLLQAKELRTGEMNFATHRRGSSNGGDGGDFSNLALDLNGVASPSSRGLPSPSHGEESLGSIIVRDCMAA